MYKVTVGIMCLLLSAQLFAGDLSKEIVGVWKVKEATVDGKTIEKGKDAACSLCDLLNSGVPLVFDATGKLYYGEGGKSSSMFYVISGKKLIISKNAINTFEIKGMKDNRARDINVITITPSKNEGINLAFSLNGHKETYLLEK